LELSSDRALSSGTDSSGESVQEEIATPMPARVSSSELIHAEIEEDADGDMRVPDSPQFFGEAGRDDLNAFVHSLGAWYFSVHSVCMLVPTKLFQLIKCKAFFYQSQAYECFKLAHAGIDAAACANGVDEIANLTLTVETLRKEFERTSGRNN